MLKTIHRIGTILLLAFATLTMTPAFCAEGIYYSIHLASFKDLQNANRYVNKLKTTGKVVFWNRTSIPGKGDFYRVYLGKLYCFWDSKI